MTLSTRALALLLVIISPLCFAQKLTSKQVSDGIYMIQGIGGNIAVSTGSQPFVIDDQLPFSSKKVIAKIQELTDQPIRFVLNTHFHADHTGGNPAMKELGALIVSHNNARTRMTKESISALFGKKNPPADPSAWPVVTFAEEMHFYINEQDIHIKHLQHAHTDGDVIIHFPKANVIHAGDVFLQGAYPIVDYHAGGSLAGVIAANEALIALANTQTKIIPGHGNLSTIDEVKAFKALCLTIQERVNKAIASGKELEQLLAEKPLDDLEAQWGSKFMPGKKAFKMIYTGEKALLAQ
ncbi:MBL fold metallo-hydrolase [Oceanicoccus sagamiensis]|uniref:beta-lactamase n=1 Tax=Oceanicoccus sagamiensis TaxID=716816 RepID=A0A1X9NDA9_9GAMM|nr:MBL fold metallo-hydrolase [Oceanicoccus sagamiensis]ARN75141.1 hypothetical protein BST96_14060 [Oceanicoccus sagamiensis]